MLGVGPQSSSITNNSPSLAACTISDFTRYYSVNPSLSLSHYLHLHPCPYLHPSLGLMYQRLAIAAVLLATVTALAHGSRRALRQVYTFPGGNVQWYSGTACGLVWVGGVLGP